MRAASGLGNEKKPSPTHFSHTEKKNIKTIREERGFKVTAKPP